MSHLADTHLEVVLAESCTRLVRARATDSGRASLAAARAKSWRLCEWYQRIAAPHAAIKAAWWSYHFASPAHRADAEAELITAERAVSPFLTELRGHMERAAAERAYREAEAARRTYRGVMRSAMGDAS